MEAALIILSLILGVISVVLGIAAIWVSLLLYRFSDSALESIQLVSNRVERSVGILEQRVQGLHQDTFSLVRETVADMRGALWSQDTTEQEGLERALEQELQGIRGELKTAFARLGVGSADKQRLQGEVEVLLRRSADAGLGARREVIKRLVLEVIQQKGGSLLASDLMTYVAQDFPFSVVMECLRELIADKAILAHQQELGPATQLRLSAQPGRASRANE